MSYDWHFEDGGHQKHTNWDIFSFAMIALYANGSWTKDRLETELTQLAVTKNNLPGGFKANTAGTELPKNPKMHTILTVMQLPKEEVEGLRGFVIPDKEGDENEAEAWIAKLEFVNNPSEKEKKEYYKALQENDGLIQFSILCAKKSTYLLEEATGPLAPIFVNFMKNDGMIVTPLMAAFLADLFLKRTPEAIHSMAHETGLYPDQSVVRGLMYSAFKGTSFTVR